MLSKAAALAASSKDTEKNFFLASIALREDGVYVHSTNSTVVDRKQPSAHAEARVLRKAGYGAVLWVARIRKKDGEWAIARPCKTCQALIENKGVKKVYYTIAPGEWGTWTPGNKSTSDYDDKKRKLCKCPQKEDT